MTVRSYQPSDRAVVEQICIRNGLRGKLEDYFSDPELFAKLWLSPFLDGEPESSWVAEHDGEVIGYLVSGIKPKFKRRAVRSLLPHLLRLLCNYMSGKYRSHPASGRFVRWMLTRSWRETPPAPAGASNFHFNVSTDNRGGKRAGDALLDAYFSALRAKGIHQFYIHVFGSAGKRDLNFYRRIGFKLTALRRCSLFATETLVATLVRVTPEFVDFHDFRKMKPAKIAVVVFGADGLDQLKLDLEGQALPANESFVVVEGATATELAGLTVLDASPTKAVEAALAATDADFIFLLPAAKRLPMDYIAGAVARMADDPASYVGYDLKSDLWTRDQLMQAVGKVSSAHIRLS